MSSTAPGLSIRPVQHEVASGVTQCDSLGYAVWKRSFDLIAGLFLGAILLPVVVVIALCVWAASGRPLLFTQERIGRRGVPFRIYKFRTMRPDAEQVLRADTRLYEVYLANGYKLPEGEDPRVTGIGRVLRKTSLDELPQLLNVLRGEMSLVGPRPIVADELEHYVGAEDVFLSALPGMTGRWQVEGRSALNYPERTECELEYMRKWSPWLDLVILCKTVKVVLSRQNAF